MRHLIAQNGYPEATELQMLERLLPLAGASLLELGCGRAWMTRQIAERFPVRQIIATEVDAIQHAKNLELAPLEKIRFVEGGMEAIPLPDASVNIAIMLKSLHHVPLKLMDQGFRELHRVLKPGGLAYISEPVYEGELNGIMRLFHDECEVREAAFSATLRAADQGLFRHQAQHFFAAPGHYPDWESFEQRMLNVTHTEHQIDPELYQRIKRAFCAHLGEDGAHFMKPSRVDLLRCL